MDFNSKNLEENCYDESDFLICDCCKNNINLIEDNVKLCYECGVLLCESCNDEFECY